MKNILKLKSYCFCRYFYHVLLLMGTIDQLPPLFGIWCDPKVDNTMYLKDLFKDWNSFHLVNYGWYLNCPKDNTTTSKFSLCEKNEQGFQEVLQFSISTQMQEGKNKGFTLGKRNQTKDIGPSQWVKSIKEIHLDVTLAPIVDLNALEQIIDWRLIHLGAPFSSPLVMSSPNFENVHPFCFTHVRPTSLILPFCRPLG